MARLRGRGRILDDAAPRPHLGPARTHPRHSGSRPLGRRTSVAALCCYKPGEPSRLIHRPRNHLLLKGARESVSWQDYRDLLVRAHIQLRAHQRHVQDVPAPPRRSERGARPRVPGAGGGQVLGHLLREVRARGDGAADGTQPTSTVVAAEDEELGAGQAARDRPDDRFGGVAPFDLGLAPVSGQILAGQGLDDDAFDV